MNISHLLVLSCLLAAALVLGCTQPSSPAGTAPVQSPAGTVLPATSAAVPASAEPAGTAVSGTPAAAPPAATQTQNAVPASSPAASVTHLVYTMKDVRDSGLHIAFQVPEVWTIKTLRVANPDKTEGLVYRTALVGNDTFYIETYAITRNQDQAFRAYFNDTLVPAPLQDTVTINGIVFDRFTSVNGSSVHVAYVAQKASANDLGYDSVIVFTADKTHPYEQSDYESIVSTFRYFTTKEASSVSGEEIGTGLG